MFAINSRDAPLGRLYDPNRRIAKLKHPSQTNFLANIFKITLPSYLQYQYLTISQKNCILTYKLTLHLKNLLKGEKHGKSIILSRN